MAAIAAAAIAAAGGIAASSSQGKKGGDSGQQLLAQIAQQLFTETAPLRQETESQALDTLKTGESKSPLLQKEKSSISAGGDLQKRDLKANLAKAGLAGSSFEITGIEAIDRAIAQLLGQAEVADTSRLTNIGTSVGFGQTPATAVSAASTLANIQGQQQIAGSQISSGSGASLGQAIALLLNRSTSPSGATTTAGSPFPAVQSTPEFQPSGV